jgi:hypothetical protein
LQARLRLGEKLLLERLELFGRHAVRVGLVALAVLLALLELAVGFVDLGDERLEAELLRSARASERRRREGARG